MMLTHVRCGRSAILILASFYALLQSAAAAEQCDSNATLSVAQYKEAPTLDPAKTFGPASDGTRYWIYDTLVRITPTGGTAPGLATSWKFTTPTTFQMTLRQGVTFHDGAPFNAAAVKANFDRHRAFPGVTANWKQPLAAVKELKVTGDYEVQYILEKANPAFAFNLAAATGMIVSPAILNQKLDLIAVGTGPFKLMKYTPDAGADLIRNDQYWDKEALACSPKTVRLVNIVDTQALLNAAVAGQLDISHVDPNQVAQAKGAGLVVNSVPTQATHSFWFDYKNTPLRHPLVRKAMMYAVNREALAKGLGLGLAVPNAQMFPADFYAYNPAPEYQPAAYKYDPAKAKQLLAQAGFPNGVTLKALVLPFPFDQALLQAVQAQMAKAGITVTSQIIANFAAYLARQGDAYFGTGGGRPDPLDYVLTEVAANGTYNPDGFAPPPELTAVLEKIANTDPANPERAKLLQQASGLVTEHALTLPILTLQFNWVLNKCVVNFTPPLLGAIQPQGLGWKAGCKR